MTIKNIIFDLGGVIYDIRYENIADRFRSYGLQDFEKYYTQLSQTPTIDQFEEGRISPAEFRDYIRGISPIPITDTQIDDAWNAILIEIPKLRWQLLGGLRIKYNTFLFSNTNQINYDCFTVRLKEKFGFDIFERCFDAAYFSHFMHTRKPSPEGFERIIREQGLVPDETVFIDDIAKNLEGAEAVGIYGLHLAQGTILDLFDNKGNISNSTFGSNYKR